MMIMIMILMILILNKYKKRQIKLTNKISLKKKYQNLKKRIKKSFKKNILNF